MSIWCKNSVSELWYQEWACWSPWNGLPLHAYHLWFYCSIMNSVKADSIYKYSTGFQATSEFMCNIFAFKFKEFGNTHVVIKLLGHKSYHTNADPPNSLCKHCQQQYSVNNKMWLRERETKSEILCEERDGERRKRNIQIDNLLVIAVAFIFVFLVIAALKIQTATPCQAWQIRTIDQWTWVRMTWHIRHARIKRTNTAACVGTELLDTTLMPYPASLARRSSEETHRKDW